MANKATKGNKPKKKPLPKKRKKSQESNGSGLAYLVPPVMVIVAGIAFVAYITFSYDELEGKVNKAAESWRIDHWQTPIPFQGEAPENFHPLAKGLSAENCKSCHLDKYQEWSESLHHEAMGPGVYGQYPHMNASGVADCNECHAPMSEQWEHLRQDGKWVKNAAYDKDLLMEGITCAACHLRSHQRHGPPLAEGKQSVSQALHGDAQRTPYFEASEFCKGCHQHNPNTLKLNGKTIENTYNEWLESPAYAKGQSCQDCHMPERRHLWKGIHDPEMTASGVTIEPLLSSETPQIGDAFEASLTITNTGTGHMFPTYTTPAVFLKAAFLDANGRAMAGHFEQDIIQRRLKTSGQWQELFDTRIAPDKSRTLKFKRNVPKGASQFKLWVWVEPDHFYEGFYRQTLQNSPNHRGREALQQALQTTLDRQYALFSKTIDIVQ